VDFFRCAESIQARHSIVQNYQSGRSSMALAIASFPSTASPQISQPGLTRSRILTPRRTDSLSSAIRICVVTATSVEIRFVAKLAAIQFPLLPGSGTTTWITDSKPLFWVIFFFMAKISCPRSTSRECSMLHRAGETRWNTGNHLDRKDFCLALRQ
jgi:hypothetical protein